MKKIIQWIKKYTEFVGKIIGEVFVIMGGFLAIYYLFDFSHSSFRIGGSITKYYYTDEAQFVIALGIALIIAGILIIRRKKK